MTLWSTSKGFSFLGMLMIMVVLSVFSAVVLMPMSPQIQSDATNTTLIRAQTLRAAVQVYRSQHGGTYPTTLNDLVVASGAACAIDTNPASGTYKQRTGWCGPYVDRPFTGDPNGFKSDGWGTLFQYNQVSVISCGPNRSCGDSDDITTSL